MRADLICIDHIGLLPITTDTAGALYRVVDTPYEEHSIARVIKPAPPGDELTPETIANANLSRTRVGLLTLVKLVSKVVSQ
jgi:hypothetical protein